MTADYKVRPLRYNVVGIHAVFSTIHSPPLSADQNANSGAVTLPRHAVGIREKADESRPTVRMPTMGPIFWRWKNTEGIAPEPASS